MLKFEYNPNKSQLNQEKHGIDFIEAQKLWQDEDLLQIPAKTEIELRWILIAKRKTLECGGYLSRRYYTHYFSPSSKK